MNTQVHSHWLCVANWLWPSHQAGERVTVAREETDSTCECASLCAQERWWGDKKTKWEENVAHKTEGSGIWRKNLSGKENFFWLKVTDGVGSGQAVKKAGRFSIDWLWKLHWKKKNDTHRTLVKSGGGSHGKAWPHVGWSTSARVSECCCLCKCWALLWWINGRFSSVQCVAAAKMLSEN